jgi:hypothetical protein
MISAVMGSGGENNVWLNLAEMPFRNSVNNSCITEITKFRVWLRLNRIVYPLRG